MKVLLVALSLIALGNAGLLPYGHYGPVIPLPLGVHALTYAAPAPLTYAAHPLIIPAPAPVIQPGYVAATKGSLHIAPLPGNTPYASHHLNLAPAPGTV